METDAASKLGPTGQRVAANVKQLRGRVPVRELSERLRRVGRPILPSGITKIEQGSRRVDVDDLMALSLVLDVTPNRLLLSEGATDERLELTPGLDLASRQVWPWASGDEPLGPGLAGDDTSGARRHETFARANRPHDPKDMTSLEELLPHSTKLQQVAELVAELEAEGVPRKATYYYTDMSLQLFGGSKGKGEA